MRVRDWKNGWWSQLLKRLLCSVARTAFLSPRLMWLSNERVDSPKMRQFLKSCLSNNTFLSDLLQKVDTREKVVSLYFHLNFCHSINCLYLL